MQRLLALATLALATLALACHGGAASPAVSGAARQVAADARVRGDPSAVRYLKGQTHLHSNQSGDSATAPADVAGWYARRGYDFIVFTDHERVTTLAPRADILTIPGVELTQGYPTCEPPEPGFPCTLHVNSLFVTPPSASTLPWPPLGSRARVDLFQRALDVSRALGGVAQLNHPNWNYAADAALVTELARRGALLLEIANEASDSNNGGDATHPSTEVLWDAALTAGATVWGVATDDAHHYDDAPAVRARGRIAHTGDRGFVMVRARRDPAAIREAMVRGDFYASTGVLLGRISATPEALEVEVDERAEGGHVFQFVGRGGRLLAQTAGRSARIGLTDAPHGFYVRAVVIDEHNRHAWTQPVRIP